MGSETNGTTLRYQFWSSLEAVENRLKELRSVGIHPLEVSTLATSETNSSEQASKYVFKDQKGLLSGIFWGAAISGVLGWCNMQSGGMVPGSVLIRLGGAAVAAIAGIFAGAILGASLFETQPTGKDSSPRPTPLIGKPAGVLVSVACVDSDSVTLVRDILQRAGGTELPSVRASDSPVAEEVVSS